MSVHQWLTVAEFRGQRHLHRAAEQALPGVLPHHARVIGGAAGDHGNAGDAPGVLLRQADVVQHHPAIPDAGGDGFLQGLRLFQNLLKHEMGIAPLLGRGRVPADAAVLLLQGGSLAVKHVHALGRQHGDLPVVHIGHVPGVPENGRGVGGDKVFPPAESDDEGAVLPGGNQGVGVVGADDAKGVGPLDPPQAASHGLQHISALPVVEFQEVGHHLGVRLGGKGRPLPGELLFQLQVVFDDAVMYQGNFSVPADVGMGVHVVGLPMGGPAGVPDAQGSLQVHAPVRQVRQDLEPPLGFADLQALCLRADGDARRVIPPVLHLTQALQQHRGRLLFPYKTNDSTHGIYSS